MDGVSVTYFGPLGRSVNESQILFSVVVPCYGHDRFLPVLIESLWAQTFDHFEIVAIDDGSTDDTKLVLESMAAKSPVPMRFVSTENHGAHAALNTGARMARGKYLAFANDDDAYSLERLDVFARATRLCAGFRWGFSAVEAMDEHGLIIDPSMIPDLTRRLAIQLSGVPLEALHALARRNTAVSSGNLVIDRQLFQRVGGFRNLRFTHDWDLILRLLAEAPPYVAERRLYRYRVHLGNAFAAQSHREGSRLADEESIAIINSQRQREETRHTYEPQIRPPLEVDPDEAFAIKVALWLMARLRTKPRLYSAARSIVRQARNLRRRR